jgi:hypothetical protein
MGDKAQIANNLLIKNTLDLSYFLIQKMEGELGAMKDGDILKKKLNSVKTNLNKANDPNFINSLGNSQKAFIDTLRDMNELLEKIKSQLLKYEDANALRKKMMGSDVRGKLRTLAYNLSTLDRVIDSVFL